MVTDFSGPFTITVNSLMGGPARRVWRLDDVPVDNEYDQAIFDAACVYGKRMHNLFCDNCHSHVALALNNLKYGGRQDWNMLRVWFALMRHGKWVSKSAALWTYLPFCCLALFVLIVCLSSTLGSKL